MKDSRTAIRYIMGLSRFNFLITLQNGHGKTERSFKSFVLACSGKRKEEAYFSRRFGPFVSSMKLNSRIRMESMTTLRFDCYCFLQETGSGVWISFIHSWSSSHLLAWSFGSSDCLFSQAWAQRAGDGDIGHKRAQWSWNLDLHLRHMQRDTTDETAGFEWEQRCRGWKLSRGTFFNERKERKEKQGKSSW